MVFSRHKMPWHFANVRTPKGTSSASHFLVQAGSVALYKYYESFASCPCHASNMEHMEDIDGHTANPETVEAIRHFRGYAKIDLSHFRLEDDHVLGSRPVGQNVETQNVLRLLKLFESVGCDREDPENYVPVLISQNTLSQAIDDSRTTQVVLLNGIEPPNLILGHGTRLLCLQGKSRIRAAQEFFYLVRDGGEQDFI